MYPIEKTLSTAENFLSNLSPYPVIGTVAGAAKIGMGTVQLTASVGLAILSAPSAPFSKKGNKWLKFAARHSVHGAANIVAGIIESIPVVQTLFYKARRSRMPQELSDGYLLKKGQERRFIGYRLLAEKDAVVERKDGNDIFYNGKPSLELSMKQAQELLGDIRFDQRLI